MVNENKKDLSNISVLDNNLNNYTNLEDNFGDNHGFELVSKNKKGKKGKKTTEMITSFDQQKKLNTLKPPNKLHDKVDSTSNLQNSKKTITNQDKKIYINNFLYYNFHKINRYIPVKDIEIDDDSTDSEYEDDFYDY